MLYVFDRGQDFRKSFKMIGGLRALLYAPFMALSASAPPDVEAEIGQTFSFLLVVNIHLL